MSDSLSWFDLSKYEQCSQLSPENWVLLMRNRRAIYYSIMGDERYPEKDVAAEFIRANCLNPLGDRKEYGSHHNERLLSVHDEHKSLFFKSVRPFTFADADTIQEDVAPEVERIKKILENPINFQTFEELKKDGNAPCDVIETWEETKCILVFDSSASNEQLIEDFANYLKEHRKLISKNNAASLKKIRKKYYADLEKWKVLPYLDIYLWKLLHNEDKEHLKVGRLLFPQEVYADVDLSERVRNTVFSKAMKAIEMTDQMEIEHDGMIY